MYIAYTDIAKETVAINLTHEARGKLSILLDHKGYHVNETPSPCEQCYANQDVDEIAM
jgi:subtilisin-like proprotein convertase family protein